MLEQSTPEEWRPVVGYEDRFAVSNHARVRKIRTWRGTRPEPLLRQHLHHTGYLFVCIERKHPKVHRLVAAAFLGACPVGKQVNHEDGNKMNNLPGNLSYVTPAENMQHADRTGLRNPSSPGIRNGRNKLTEDEVRAIRNLDDINRHIVAGWFGVTATMISRIRNGLAWTHLDASGVPGLIGGSRRNRHRLSGADGH